MTTPLTLVSHDLCPYVQRAAITLLEKAVPFERTMIDLAAKPDWFLKLSPRGKVPLLQVARPHGGSAALFESDAICEFIEETQPGPRLHPTDPITRAEHRAWMAFASAVLADLWGLETAREKAPFDAKLASIAERFARIETALGAGPYFAGADFSLVDAAFAPVFRYFDLFEMLKDLALFEDKPKTRAWRAALSIRPSVRAAVGADYPELLRAFLVRHDAYLLKPAA